MSRPGRSSTSFGVELLKLGPTCIPCLISCILRRWKVWAWCSESVPFVERFPNNKALRLISHMKTSQSPYLLTWRYAYFVSPRKLFAILSAIAVPPEQRSDLKERDMISRYPLRTKGKGLTCMHLLQERVLGSGVCESVCV